jgi:hypothetical protein
MVIAIPLFDLIGRLLCEIVLASFRFDHSTAWSLQQHKKRESNSINDEIARAFGFMAAGADPSAVF